MPLGLPFPPLAALTHKYARRRLPHAGLLLEDGGITIRRSIPPPRTGQGGAAAARLPAFPGQSSRPGEYPPKHTATPIQVTLAVFHGGQHGDFGVRRIVPGGLGALGSGRGGGGGLPGRSRAVVPGFYSSDVPLGEPVAERLPPGVLKEALGASDGRMPNEGAHDGLGRQDGDIGHRVARFGEGDPVAIALRVAWITRLGFPVAVTHPSSGWALQVGQGTDRGFVRVRTDTVTSERGEGLARWGVPRLQGTLYRVAHRATRIYPTIYGQSITIFL